MTKITDEIKELFHNIRAALGAPVVAVELTDEQLSIVSGGCSSTDTRKECPNCGSKNTELSPNTKGKSVNGMLVTYYRCKDCKKVFYVI